MKKVFRVFAVETFALYLASIFAAGLIFDNGTETIIFAGVGLTFASLVVKPVINLLLLPINLITFNLFKWVSSAIALYLVTLVINGFRIEGFVMNLNEYGLPNIALSNAPAFVAFSLTISLLTGFLYWLIS